MTPYIDITKALADESRLRVLMLLEQGELCLCQLIAVLELSPSTVSKHMSILSAAGLITVRKDGRWHYYKLAGRGADQHVRDALKWVRVHLRDQPQIQQDRDALSDIADKSLEEVSCCYR